MRAAARLARLPLAALGAGVAPGAWCDAERRGWWPWSSSSAGAPGLRPVREPRRYDTRGDLAVRDRRRGRDGGAFSSLEPLATRYVGTRVERSPRALVLMNDSEVEACARLINDLVDLDFFDEEDEQEIFEFSVCHVAEVLSFRLPNRVIELVHNDKTMTVDEAEGFGRKLLAHCLGHVDLPFLDALDRRCVVHCVVKLVTRSMTLAREPVGSNFTADDHNRFVQDIFLRSVHHRFTDADERAALAAEMAAFAEKLPLLPCSVVASFFDRTLCDMAESVTSALGMAYEECNAAFLRDEPLTGGRDALIADALGLEAAHGADAAARVAAAPFEYVFRYHLLTALMKRTDLFIAWLPEDRQRRIILYAMDECVRMIETDKLEAMFNRGD